VFDAIKFFQCIFLLIATPSLSFAQADIRYKFRGDRWEGTRPEPVSGFEVELLSATVNYTEPRQPLGETIHARFFLEKHYSAPHLLVRELDNRHYYWLDQVQPSLPWQPGRSNEYSWPTSAVIRPLGDLELHQLGIVVRLEQSTPKPMELVAPCILYQSSIVEAVNGYRFSLRLLRGGSDLKAQIFAESELGNPIWSIELGTRFADAPVTVVWPLDQKTSRGWYRLVVTGFSLGSGQSVSQVVRFYHEPLLR
jgi:hypothetical protein